MKDKIKYYLLLGSVKFLSLFPLSALYVLSDAIYMLLRYMVRYRRKVVRANLASAFPEKSDEEREKIEKEFYHYFCDLMVEGVKSYRMSYEEMLGRVEFEGLEIMTEFLQNGTNIIADVAHRCNWEWIPALYRQVNLPNVVMGEFFRPGRNEYVNKMLEGVRHRLGVFTVNKNEALRALVKLKKENKTFAIGLLADQSPSVPNIHYWTDFLNKETAFLSGPERIAKMFKAAMIYIDVERVSRGHYKYVITTITPDASKEEENEPTRRYVELLEKSIRREPAYWLWSHRRWKHDRKQIEAMKASEKQEKA